MENMTQDDKQFIQTLIDAVIIKVDSLEKIFQKDIDASNNRVGNIENRQDEFREDFRAIYPRLTIVEGKVKTLMDKNKDSSSLKSNIISGVIVGIVVFIITYFLI